MGPKNLALAGEVADGWLGFLFSPEHAGGFREHLAAGAARAGRDLDGFDVAPNVQVHISDDLAAARDAMRPFLALYIGGMGSRERNFYTEQASRYGFEAAAREVQEHYLAGNRPEAMAALPELQAPTRTSWRPRDVRACLRLALWDADQNRMLTWDEVAWTR